LASLGGLFVLTALAGAASAASPEAGRAVIAPAALISGGSYVMRGLAGQPQAGTSAGGDYWLSGGWLAPATQRPITATALPPTPTPPATSSLAPQTPTPSATPASSDTPGPTLNFPSPTAPASSTPPECFSSVPGQYDPQTPDQPGPQRLFLPAVLRGSDPALAASVQSALADLVTQFEICRLDASGRITLRVTVTNIGEAATPADGFWVEAYLNPAEAPARALPWDEACATWPCYGATWEVDRPLNPGESVTLLEGDLASGHSLWPATPPGQIRTLYVYADSRTADADPAGLVREADEGNNRSDLPEAWASGEMAEPATVTSLPDGPARGRP
jgi:hypothetical protein